VTARPRTAAEPSVDAIADALVTASRLLLDITARAVAVVDDTLTVPQLRVLALLSSHGPTNLTTLAAQLDVQPSTIGRMADRRSDRPAQTPEFGPRDGRRTDAPGPGRRGRRERPTPC
jgi:DNA-binding MarR family transcriptional regulator